MSTTDLLKELRSHYIAVLAYSLGDHRTDVTKADATSAEIAAVRAFIAHLEAETMQVAAIAPIGAKKPAQRQRCPFYREIRRVFNIARSSGLDTKADEAMRAAFGQFLGRAIETREALDRSDWLLIGDAIKLKKLTW